MKHFRYLQPFLIGISTTGQTHIVQPVIHINYFNQNQNMLGADNEFDENVSQWPIYRNDKSHVLIVNLKDKYISFFLGK